MQTLEVRLSKAQNDERIIHGDFGTVGVSRQPRFPISTGVVTQDFSAARAEAWAFSSLSSPTVTIQALKHTYQALDPRARLISHCRRIVGS